MNVVVPTIPDSATEPPAAPHAAREAPLRPALRAIIFKEMRPTLPFTLMILAFVGLLTILPALLDLMYPDRRVSRTMDSINFLANYNFEVLLVPLAALVGLLVGVSQAVASRGVDHWAFLMHRPIRRGYLFLGRALAALLLYGIAAGIPAAILMAWAALSSRPPYDWHMNLPVLVDLAGGSVYLFAGMLLVERKAFIGWRVLPLGALLVMSVSVVLLPWFGVSALVVAGFATLLGLAALGSHVSNGNQLPAPGITHCATIITLFLGGTVLLGALSLAARTGALSIADEWGSRIEQQSQPGPVYRGHVTRYLLLPNGTVGREVVTLPRTVDPAHPDATQQSWVYYGLGSDQPIEQPTGDQVNELNRHRTTVRLEEFRANYRDVSHGAEPGGLEVRRENGNITQIQHEKWFALPNAGVLKGYDAFTNAYIGSIGLDGFAPPGHSAMPFTFVSGSYFGLGPRGIYTADLTRHTTQLQIEFPAGFTLRGQSTIVKPSLAASPADSSWYDVFRGDDRLLIYDPRQTPQKLIATLMLSEPKAPYVQLTVFRGPAPDGGGGRWAVGTVNRHVVDPREAGTATFDIYDPTGKLLEHQTVPEALVADPPMPVPSERIRLAHEVSFVEGTLDAVGNLPALQALWTTRLSQDAPNLMELNNLFGDWYDAGAGIALVASGVAVLWIARRYRARFGAAWVLAALIFGPVVGLVLIATHTLPRRGLCPACGRRRAFETERCPHCGKAWPAPETNGTEIFAFGKG